MKLKKDVCGKSHEKKVLSVNQEEISTHLAHNTDDLVIYEIILIRKINPFTFFICTYKHTAKKNVIIKCMNDFFTERKSEINSKPH